MISGHLALQQLKKEQRQEKIDEDRKIDIWISERSRE